MKPEVKMDIVLPHSPERVWDALTDPRALAAWMLPNDFVPRLGHRFCFRPMKERRNGPGGEVRCEVVELEAPRRLAYTWHEGAEALPDLVTWTLEPVESGTRVRLEHVGPSDLRACAGVISGRSLPEARLLFASLIRFLSRPARPHAFRRGQITFRGERLLYCVAPLRFEQQLEEVLR